MKPVPFEKLAGGLWVLKVAGRYTGAPENNLANLSLGQMPPVTIQNSDFMSLERAATGDKFESLFPLITVDR
jgi:hypothetical protein